VLVGSTSLGASIRCVVPDSGFEDGEGARVLAEPIKGRDPGVVRKPALVLLDMLVEQLLTVATGWGPL